MKNLIFLIFVLLLASLFSQTNIVEIYIVSNINGSVFTNESKIAFIDDFLKMSIVGKCENSEELVYYSNSEKLQIDGLVINENDIHNWNELDTDLSIKWFKVEEADGEHYNNTSPTWHWEDIPYTETEIMEWKNRFEIFPDVEPTIFEPVFCDGKVVGTMRFKATLIINGKTFSTPGKNSKYKGSISHKVHRLSLKGNTDNEVINYAFAMCNLPYIWGSANFSNDHNFDNQAERFIGADCADFAVAAHQLAGNQIPYDQIKNNRFTKIISTVKDIENSNYLDRKRELIIVGNNGIKVADFIYWNYDKPGTGHVGLFYEDKSDPNGENKGNADAIFNEWDLVIHTLFHEPEIKRIGEAFSGNIRVYRIRD
ncbi:MAG TPA: hypothetical protein ENL20_00820 [Candidatus Cloacimonetes bacterium]|nr:hypothetical protein [Candidatus Cloacimonadota bacterium]